MPPQATVWGHIGFDVLASRLSSNRRLPVGSAAEWRSEQKSASERGEVDGYGREAVYKSWQPSGITAFEFQGGIPAGWLS